MDSCNDKRRLVDVELLIDVNTKDERDWVDVRGKRETRWLYEKSSVWKRV